jgi:hypothetical protein
MLGVHGMLADLFVGHCLGLLLLYPLAFLDTPSPLLCRLSSFLFSICLQILCCYSSFSRCFLTLRFSLRPEKAGHTTEACLTHLHPLYLHN